MSSDDELDDFSEEEEDVSEFSENENVKVKVNKTPAAAKKAPAKAKTGGTKQAQSKADVDEQDERGNGRSDSAKKALASKFEKLTPREHVLKRPDTYVGSTESLTQPMWVYENGRMIERPLTFVPALYKIFDEILVNAADNKRRDATMKEIRVDIDKESGRITVRNDGKGIPVEKHEKHGIYIPEMIFGHLLTGENFNDEEQRVVGGRNGYGAKLANIFSTTFKVETSDKASEQCYTQIWTNNMEVCNKAKITKAKSKDYTEVSFIPDYPRFGMTGLDADMMALFRKRVYDVAGVTDKTVKVYLNGELIPCNTFEKYVKLYTEEPATAAPATGGESGEGGAPSPAPATAASPAAGKNKKTVIFAEINERWQLAVTCSKDAQATQVSFVNSICTYKGGQHVQYLTDQIVKHVMEYIAKKHKSHASVVKPTQIKSHLWIFANALIVNPSFDSQTKENLTTRPPKFGPKEFSPEIKDSVLDKIVKQTGIVENVLFWANQKQMKDLKKVGGKKKITLLDIPKLDDANNAGGKNSHECTLILTEGDSAKTLALSGISVVGRDNFGVFPLKGKLLNVREAGHAQIMKNVEIQNLMRIIGLKPGVVYDSTKDLRYGHVMVMTDQDQDGSHIKGLVFNFFHFYFPSLIKIPGFLQVFVTPLVKVSKKERTLAFYSLREYDEWKIKVSKEAREKLLRKEARASEEMLKTTEVAALKAWRVKYYKGLGTNSSKEAQEYFAKIDSHSITMQFDDRSADAIDMAFSKSRVDDRKTWLLGHNPESFTPVDFRAKSLDYKHFVDGELVLFSLADNVRSIPSVLDGFKPSQRKVLFACLKRNLVQEIKVSQLSGYVSEHAAYHHGEESLSGTIVNMAQSFVGSNNIPLLHAGGAFGTRRLGGKDSASPRYIFTKLLKVTRAVYHPDDDALLKRNEDDGMLVEPKFYVPVLPMLLINGSSGIGTGWSTEVPCFNPRTVIECLRMRLAGVPDEAPKLVPYYKGFTGDIVEEIKPKKGSSGRYYVRGKFELVDDKLFITELPVGKWTGVYKEFLIESISNNEGQGGGGGGAGAGGKKDKKDDKAGTAAATPFGKKTFPEGAIKEIRENHTDETVAFELTLSPEFADQLRQGGAEYIMTQFQLQTTISTSNMHAFDEHGFIRKYESPEEILDAFFAYRLPLYAERKKFLEKELSRECEKLSAQARFVKMIVEGQLVISRKSRTQILSELQRLGFPKWFKSRIEEEEAGTGEGAVSIGGENDNNDVAMQGGDDEDEDKSGKGYDYLLSMTFWSLTMEKFKALEKKAGEKAAELVALQKKKPEGLWTADLDELVKVLDEMDEDDELTRADQAAARGKMKRGGGGGKGGRKRPLAVKKKKAAAGSDEDMMEISSSDDDDLLDDDDDEDDDFGKKKKKPAPKGGKKGAAQVAPPVASAPVSSKPIISSSMITANSLKPVPAPKPAKEPKEPKESKEATKKKAAAPKEAKKPAVKRAKVAKSSDDDESDISDSDLSVIDDVVAKPRPKRANATSKKAIVISDDEESDEVQIVEASSPPSGSSSKENDEFDFTPDATPKVSKVGKTLQLKKSPDRVAAPAAKKSLREQFEEELAMEEASKKAVTKRVVEPKREEKKPARAAATKAKPKYTMDNDSLLGDDDDEEEEDDDEEDESEEDFDDDDDDDDFE